jgi:hypothetical protein
VAGASETAGGTAAAPLADFFVVVFLVETLAIILNGSRDRVPLAADPAWRKFSRTDGLRQEKFNLIYSNLLAESGLI